MLLQPALGENLSRLSNVLFWDGRQRHEPGKTYETLFQRDFKSYGSIAKRVAFPPPVPAKIELRDSQHFKEFQTEAKRAFSSHCPVPICRIPAWTRLGTNYKMPSDEQYINFHTTHSESFQHVTAPDFRPSRHVVTVQQKQQEDKLPPTTQKASYVPHKVSLVSKAKTKHLGGAPAITGDRKFSSFSSNYNDEFQYRWCAPTESTVKQFHSAIPMGDNAKIVKNETTHSASFCRAGARSPVSLKEHLCFNLGDDQDHKWTTTTADTFTEIKPDRVHVEPVNRNLSSILQRDTDDRRNQDRMMATTNHVFFSEKNSEFPVHVDGASIRTKSNVQLGQPRLNGTFYITTTQENYPQKQLAPARPQCYPPGRVLAQQETGPALSTVQSDYTPPKSKRNGLNPGKLHQMKASHIRLPYSEHCFTTTNKEAFEPKPISKASLKTLPPSISATCHSDKTRMLSNA